VCVCVCVFVCIYIFIWLGQWTWPLIGSPSPSCPNKVEARLFLKWAWPILGKGNRANIELNAGRLLGKRNRARISKSFAFFGVWTTPVFVFFLKQSTCLASPSSAQHVCLLTHALNLNLSLSNLTPNWIDRKGPNLSISESLKSPSCCNTDYRSSKSKVRVFPVVIFPFMCFCVLLPS